MEYKLRLFIVMKIYKKIWNEAPKTFMDIIHTSQKNVLHPEIARIINGYEINNLLDYGCGDGRLIELLNKNIKVSMFDINIEMLELSRKRLGNRILKTFEKVEDIPKSQYDCVVLSMVLVCVDNKEEYINIFKNIKGVKTRIGKVIIAVTHPCFREAYFSNFHTSYSDEQPFKYLKEGEPFNVYLEDEMSPTVAFQDYHWSLSFTMNTAIESGLTIEKVIELSDDSSHSKFNGKYSTFAIIICH